MRPSQLKALLRARGTTPAADPRPVSVLFGGSFLAGDPAAIPEGYVRLMQNMLPRPGGRFDARPPFVYDSLSNIVSLASWTDLTNQQTRFVALDASKHPYLKAASGETFGSSLGTAGSGVRITDYANYRGKLFMMLDDGASNPTSCLMWDGTNLVTGPFNSPIVARTVTTFVDRLFFCYPRHTITPLTSVPLTFAYNWPTSSAFVFTNVKSNFIQTATGQFSCRLSPTSTAAKACDVLGLIFTFGAGRTGVIGRPASPFPAPMTWRAEFRNVDASYDLPFTMELLLMSELYPGLTPSVSAVGVGDILSATAADGNDYIYRCTVAGTIGAAPPVWPTQQGATVVDGGVTWINDGSAILASLESTLPNATTSPGFTTFYLTCTVPSNGNGTNIAPRLKFYNSASTALTKLSSIDISFKDGLTDGDPAKSNHGQQWTNGDIELPFFNKESTASLTVNLESIIWSETSDYETIRAANTFEPKESAGLPTAAHVLSGRFLMFKRRAFWTFKPTGDPDTPIIPETPARVGIGCLGPRALDNFNDELFWIAENEIYHMRVGNDPQPLCGDAMREEIMTRGANWVESQATYNMPILSIDLDNHEVWVYTQKGKLYCCHLPVSGSIGGAPMWTVHTTPNGAEVSAMAFCTTTRKMEVAFGGSGLCRLDPSVTAQDKLDGSATSYPGACDIILKPFELYTPRFELSLQELAIYHLATASQVAETLYVYASTDRGATFPHYNEVTFDPAVPRIAVGLGSQFGVSVMPKISHVGSLGAAAWSVSRGEAIIELLAGEWPFSNPTPIASNI